MNAVVPTEWKPPRDIGSFTTDTRDERSARRPARLSPMQAESLRYMWAGISVDLGVRSPHGALEARLLRAPPRNVDMPILEELARLGRWVCEGELLWIVTTESSTRVPRGVPGELKLALKRMVRDGIVERREAPIPDVKPPVGRSNAEQLRIERWTGFEVRRAQSIRTALARVPLTREEKKRLDDEAFERELHVCYGSETRPSPSSFEPPENIQNSLIGRARRALSKLTAFDARVIQAIYGAHRITETAEEEAVRFLVGGDVEKARAAMAAACKAFREAWK